MDLADVFDAITDDKSGAVSFILEKALERKVPLMCELQLFDYDVDEILIIIYTNRFGLPVQLLTDYDIPDDCEKDLFDEKKNAINDKKKLAKVVELFKEWEEYKSFEECFKAITLPDEKFKLDVSCFIFDKEYKIMIFISREEKENT